MNEILDVITNTLKCPEIAKAYEKLTPLDKIDIKKEFETILSDVYDEGYDDAKEECEYEAEEGYAEGFKEGKKHVCKYVLGILKKDDMSIKDVTELVSAKLEGVNE